MLEKTVAGILNYYLGKYFFDFDTDNLNVGIFSGDIRLTDLNFKPEALFELNLPIAVRFGKIESMTISIPWSFLKSRPTIIKIDGAWLIAEPCLQNGSVQREKRLKRAARRYIIDAISHDIQSNVAKMLLFDLQVTINDVHVRYEDDSVGAACGFCLQSVTMNATDKKWKPLSEHKNGNSAFHILKFEALSFYWDAKWTGHRSNDFYDVRNEMSETFKKYTMYKRQLDFILKPLTLKTKITVIHGDIFSLQLDSSVSDLVMQLSYEQLISVKNTADVLKRAENLRNWIHLRPVMTFTKKSSNVWWKYLCKAVIEQRIAPYRWSNILMTRQTFRRYRDLYLEMIKHCAEAEYKLDMLKFEDELNITNVVIAQEQARIMLQQSKVVEGELLSPIITSKQFLKPMDHLNIKLKIHLAIGSGNLNITKRNNDIMCVHFNQLSAQIEQYLLTLKVQTFLIEGITHERTLLAPIISSSEYDQPQGPILAIEIKRNLTNASNLFHLQLQALEIAFNQYFLAELIAILNILSWKIIKNTAKRASFYSFPKNFHVKFDIQPCKLVISESGCLQKGGGVQLIVTPGYLEFVKERIQYPDSDTGLAELEERLYSRWRVNFTNAEIIIVDSGDPWRETLQASKNTFSILHRCSGQVLFLSSLWPDENRLPKKKYNVTINSLEVQFSNGKINMLIDLIENFPTIKFNMLGNDDDRNVWAKDVICTTSELNQFLSVKRLMASCPSTMSALSTGSLTNASSIRSTSNENLTETNFGDDMSSSNKIYDFEESISPLSPIDIIVQINIMKSCLTITRAETSNRMCAARTFLQLRTTRLSLEYAQAQLGHCAQFTLESIILNEQIHTDYTGKYLELICTDQSPQHRDALNIIYRQVSANNPNFRTHFKSTETFVHVEIGRVKFRWRLDVCRSVCKHIRRLKERVRNSKALRGMLSKYHRHLMEFLKLKMGYDLPPVAPGAIKFNYTARVQHVTISLIDASSELFESNLNALEVDYVSRANDKLKLRFYLNDFNVTDLRLHTLYPKILTTEDDFVLDVKYIEHRDNILQKNHTNVSCDATLHVQVGRVAFVPLSLVDIKFMLKLAADKYTVKQPIKRTVYDFFTNHKLLLSVQVNGPTLILPLKYESPNLLLMHNDGIFIENFYNQVDMTEENIKSPYQIVNNILIKINGLCVSRAIASLTTQLQAQCNILEPFSIHIDIKNNLNCGNFGPIWNFSCNVDPLKLSLAEFDLVTILGVYLEYFPKTRKIVKDLEHGVYDQSVNDLQEFLSSWLDDNEPWLIAKVIFDGLHLELVNNSQVILSSPVKHWNRAFCTVSATDCAIFGALSGRKNKLGRIQVQSFQFNDAHLNSSPEVKSDEKICVFAEYEQNNTTRAYKFYLNDVNVKVSTQLIPRLITFCYECSLPLFDRVRLEVGMENKAYDELDLVDPSIATETQIKIENCSISAFTEDQKNQFRFSMNAAYEQNFNGHYFKLENISLVLFTFNRPCEIISEFDVNVEVEETIKATVDTLKFDVQPVVVQVFAKIINEIQMTLSEEKETSMRNAKPSFEQEALENMWLPKKIPDIELKPNANQSQLLFPFNFQFKNNQSLILTVNQLQAAISLEINHTIIPIALLRSKSCIEIRQGIATITNILDARYFDESKSVWNHLIETLNLTLNIFTASSLPVNGIIVSCDNNRLTSARLSLSVSHATKISNSLTTSDSDDLSASQKSGFETLKSKSNGSGLTHNDFVVAEDMNESESEFEDDMMDRLTTALTGLFVAETDDHDSDSSSSTNSRSWSKQTPSHTQDIVETVYAMQNQTSIYVIIHSSQTIDFTIHPSFIRLLCTFIETCENNTLSIASVNVRPNSFTLINKLGQDTAVELFENDRVILRRPSMMLESPTSSAESSPEHESNCSARIDWNDIFDDRLECSKKLLARITQYKLKIKVPNLHECTLICPWDRSTNVVKIEDSSIKSRVYYVVVDFQYLGLSKSLMIRTNLQIKNETSYVISLFYDASILKNMNVQDEGDAINPFEIRKRLTLLQPHEMYSVPFYVAHHCQFYLLPIHLDFKLRDDGFTCADLNTPRIEGFTLKKIDHDKANFFINITKESKSEMDHLILIQPPIIMHNCLPNTIQCEWNDSKNPIHIDAAQYFTLYDANPIACHALKLTYESYSGSVKFDENHTVRNVQMQTVESNDKLNICIRIEWRGKSAGCVVTLYAPYWILNRTELQLQIKACGNETITQCQNERITMWSWPRHTRRRRLRLRVDSSSWSSAFPLDSSNCHGQVVCKDKLRSKQYPILVHIKRSKVHIFTKFIIFHPMFVVSNCTRYNLRFMEANEQADLWFDLAPNAMKYFWPETSSMRMYMKLDETYATTTTNALGSVAFPFAQQHFTALRTERMQMSFCVSVEGGNNTPFHTSFHAFKPGDAPVLLINRCKDTFLKFNQYNVNHTVLLSPFHELLYTWDDPCERRTLLWNVYNNKAKGFEVSFSCDGEGEQIVDDGKGTRIYIYWLSYVDREQRCLLFTQTKKAIELHKCVIEKSQLEVYLSLSNIGVSLLGTNNHKELIYATINDRAAVWEIYISKKWKVLNADLSAWIEYEYKKRMPFVMTTSYKCSLKNYIEVDLQRMILLKPFFGELRRSYAPGLWCQLRQSANNFQLNAHVQNIQIDEQINNRSSSACPIVVNFDDNFVPSVELKMFFSMPSCDKISLHSMMAKFENFRVNLDDCLVERLEQVMLYIAAEKSQTEKMQSDMQLLYTPVVCIARDELWHICKCIVSQCNVQINLVHAPNFLAKYSQNSTNGVLNKMVTFRYLPYQLINIKISKEKLITNIIQNYCSRTVQQFKSLVEKQAFLASRKSDVTHNVIDNVYTLKLNAANAVALAEAVFRLLGHIHGGLDSICMDNIPSLPFCCTQSDVARIEAANNLLEVIVFIKSLLNAHSLPRREKLLKNIYRNITDLMDDKKDAETDLRNLAIDMLTRARITKRIRLSRVVGEYDCKLMPYNETKAIGQSVLDEVAMDERYWYHCVSGLTVFVISLKHFYVIKKRHLWSAWDVEFKLSINSISDVSSAKDGRLFITYSMDKNENSAQKEYIVSDTDSSLLDVLKTQLGNLVILTREMQRYENKSQHCTVFHVSR